MRLVADHHRLERTYHAIAIKGTHVCHLTLRHLQRLASMIFVLAKPKQLALQGAKLRVSITLLIQIVKFLQEGILSPHVFYSLNLILHDP